MEKVKVTKEVAEAIERQLARRSREDLLLYKADNVANLRFFMEKDAVLNDIPFDDLAKALYIGYETDKTLAVKVAKEIERLQREVFNANSAEMREYYKRRADGIKWTLDTLRIKIEEVND